MCGIVGLWEFGGSIDTGLLESMRDTLGHRGPDDRGVYVDPGGQVGLGHRRLSILDLTDAGHQPMSYDAVWAVHNGEIYNFREIRDRLAAKGYTFESNSDTEVILKGYREWGVKVVDSFRGMFATALWDSKERRLRLVRDRAGVKPLYYYRTPQRFVFASELRAIAHHPAFKRELDLDSLALYLKFGYVPAPRTIFRDVAKLEPGHILTVGPDGNVDDQTYWNVFDCYRRTENVSPAVDEAAATDELERLLTESFKLRLVSDVPVGVFLSGGVDSSTVAALLQKESGSPISTFTIGFEDEAYDEAESAKKIADHLGTDHHELYLDPKLALDIIPRLPDIYDEPFGDASGIPTYLVSKFARDRVKVALSADGGDELFAGYQLHQNLSRAYRTFSRLGPFKKLLVGMGGLSPLKRLLDGRVGGAEIKLEKLREVLAGRPTMSRFYYSARSIWSDTATRRLIKHDTDAFSNFLQPFSDLEGIVGNFTDFMRAADYRSYLPDDILVKVDRATMAVGLEGRDPFLDPGIVEYAAGLRHDFLVRGRESKYILKRILRKYVPRELVERPKKGFVVPLNLWLKNELRSLLTDYINERRIVRGGVFDWPTLRRELDNYLSGDAVDAGRLWFVLEFELWRERWLDRATG